MLRSIQSALRHPVLNLPDVLPENIVVVCCLFVVGANDTKGFFGKLLVLVVGFVRPIVVRY
jgi:hypothetical protein